MSCPDLHELPPPPAGKTGWPWTEGMPRLPETMADGRPWPRISVVTPSYNQGAYLEETIRSALLQGYPNLEYIVIDGGSTDASLAIIKTYAPWLDFWVAEPDRGQSHAINKGWARASGSLLAYINSDDVYLPGAFAAAAEGFSAHQGAGMVYGAAEIVDERGAYLRRWEARPYELRTMLAEGNSVPQPAAFFSSRALATVGTVREDWQMIMDYELCIRIGERFPAVCLLAPLARFRDHASSKTRSRFESTATELLRFVAAFETHGLAPQALCMLKKVTLSRIYYEWAMGALARGRHHWPLALRLLFSSLTHHPSFALRRPLDTMYIIKEVAVSVLTQKAGGIFSHTTHYE